MACAVEEAVRTSFDTALANVLAHEGGYVDNPHDKGGPTNRGITQHVYSDWLRDRGLPDMPVKSISPAEVLSIYKSLYWNPVKGDRLPSGVDYAAFDFAVNSGTGRASRYLQQAVGVVQDGVIGPNTLAVVSAAPATAVIDTLCDLRLAYLRQLRDFQYFGDGWTSRISDVRVKAKAMAS
jgi:lysozyme family protein